MTVRETRRGKRIVGVTAHGVKPHRVTAHGVTPGTRAPKRRRITVALGSHRFTLGVGHTKTVHVSLNRAGHSLLADRKRLRVTLHVTATVAKRARRVKTATITFTKPKRRH